MPNSIYQGIDYNKSFIQGRQNIQYYDIKDMDILVEDNSAFSSQYFKIIQSPTQLEGGKNALFLLGDSEMLEKDTEILIEVLDANGDNIFVETTEYGPDRLWDIKFSNTIQDAKGGKRCVAIWLQEDAAPEISRIFQDFANFAKEATLTNEDLPFSKPLKDLNGNKVGYIKITK